MNTIERMAQAMIENICEQDIGYTSDVSRWNGQESIQEPLKLVCDGVIDFKAVADAAFDILTARPSVAAIDAGADAIYRSEECDHVMIATAVFHDMIQAMKEGK